MKALLNMCEYFCEKNGWRLSDTLGQTGNESIFIWIGVYLRNHCKSGISSLVSIPKEITTNLWFSSTSGAKKSERLYIGYLGSELSPSSSVKMLT